MKVEQKQEAVDRLVEKLADAHAFYLTDFTGLDVKNMTELRARLRDAGVEYLVVKNTLAQRALGGLDLPELEEFFVGPTGLVIGRDEAVAAAKVLDEFASEHDDRPTVKIGVVDRRKMSPEDVGRLAKLPSRDELMAELVGVMEAPLSQLAAMMQGMLQEVVGLLEALRAEREGS